MSTNASARSSSGRPPPPPHRQVSLTRDELNRATTLFDDMDRNHDGVVDIAEFQAVMEAIGARSGRAHSFDNVRRMFMEADRNGDGVIDYDEWIWVQKKQKAKKLGVLPPTPPLEPEPPEALPDGSGGGSGSGAVLAAAALRNAAELRGLLTALAEHDDLELAREAEWMLDALDERAISGGGRGSGRGGGRDEDEAAAMLPAARNERHRAASIELANSLGGGEGGGGEGGGGGGGGRERASSSSLRVDVPSPGGGAAGGGGGGGAGLGGAGLREVAVELGTPGQQAEEEEEEAEEEEDEDDEDEDGGVQGGEVTPVERRRRRSVVEAARTTAGRASACMRSLSALAAPLEILISQGQNTGLTNTLFLRLVERKAEQGSAGGGSGDGWERLALEWARCLSWMDCLNLDLTSLERFVRVWPRGGSMGSLSSALAGVPFVTLYLHLVVLLPLSLSLLMILWQKPLTSVVWMFLLMGGLMLLVASSVGQLLIDPARLELLNLRISRNLFQACQLAGVALVAAFLLRAALASYWGLKTELMKSKFKMRLAAERAKRKDVRALQQSLLGRFRDASGPRSPLALLRSAGLCAALVLLSFAAELEAELSSVDTREQLGGTYLSMLLTAEVRTAPPAAGCSYHPVRPPPSHRPLQVRAACWVLAAGFGLHLGLCLSRPGRTLLREMAYWTNRFFLGFVLLLLSLLYTPITKQLLSVLLCTERRCPRGEWYPKRARSWLGSFFDDATIDAGAAAADSLRPGGCAPCRFVLYPPPANGTVGAGAAAAEPALLPALEGSGGWEPAPPVFGASCPAFADSCPGEVVRVVACTAHSPRAMLCDASHGFYVWTSALMVVGFVLLVPYLFYSLIAHHTKILKQIPIDATKLADAATAAPPTRWRRLLCLRSPGQSEVALAWDYRVAKTRNRAKSLYEHFEWEYRYFRLVLLLHRLLLVCVALLIPASAVLACALSIGIHAAFLLLTATQQPYLNPAADALSAAAALANLANPALLLLAWHGALDGASALACRLLLLGLNFGLPALCACSPGSASRSSLAPSHHPLASPFPSSLAGACSPGSTCTRGGATGCGSSCAASSAGWASRRSSAPRARPSATTWRSSATRPARSPAPSCSCAAPPSSRCPSC